jgi:dUTP pyrophosphatase
MSKVQFWFDPKYPDAKLPEFGSEQASGMDVFAAEDCELQGFGLALSENSSPGAVPVSNTGWLTLVAPKPTLVHTGIWLAGLEKGHELQVRSRSGNTLKCSFFVMNEPGTVDSDYRAEVGCILEYLGTGKYQVKKGQKIAQLVEMQVVRSMIERVDQIVDLTKRGTGGFGSTGA